MSEWDDDYDEDELDLPDDSDPVLVTCPNCGADVYEDAEQCPSCGDYIVHSMRAWDEKPTWWIVIGIAGIIATILVLSGLAAFW